MAPRSPRSSGATSTSTRRPSATRAGSSSPSSAAGRTPRSAPSSSATSSTASIDPARAVDAHQAARVRGAGVRGRRGAASSCSSAATPPTTSPRSGSSTTPCLVEQRDGRELLAEATVKVEVDGEVLHTAADGNGPVNALDAALRKALGAFYPGLDEVHLVDYKVRILDGGAATAARTRVIIDSTGRRADLVDDGQRHEHHRGVGVGARRFARVRDLEVRLRAAATRRAPLHDRAGARHRSPGTGNPRGDRDPTEVTPMPERTSDIPDLATDSLHLARWTATSGSNAQSRGAVVIAAGDHEWRASAEGTAPSMPSIARWTRRSRRPDRAPAAAGLRHPRARRGDRHDRRGDGPDRAAGHRRAARER